MNESKPTQLKPCPFCRGEAKWLDYENRVDGRWGLVVNHAEDCWLNLPTDWSDDEAIAAWDTRSGDATELLREALEAIAFCSGSCDKAIVDRIDTHLGEA